MKSTMPVSDMNRQHSQIMKFDDPEELFVVVDENDAVIGYRTRQECHQNPSLIHRTIGVLVFSTDGRVLLQKRSRQKDMDPGRWGTSCAGHVRKGQTYLQTAIRELEEELGIATPLSFITKFIERGEHETEYATLYRTSSDGPFSLCPEEVETVRFYHPDELRQLIASGTLAITLGCRLSLTYGGVL